MSTDLTTDPIKVHANPAIDQVATGIRYALMAVSAIASALGYAGIAGKFNALLVVAGPVATAGVFIWGQISSRQSSQTKATLAAQLPDSVAQFK